MTGDKGLRVNSVRRENPLMAFNLAHPDENSIGALNTHYTAHTTLAWAGMVW